MLNNGMTPMETGSVMSHSRPFRTVVRWNGEIQSGTESVVLMQMEMAIQILGMENLAMVNLAQSEMQTHSPTTPHSGMIQMAMVTVTTSPETWVMNVQVNPVRVRKPFTGMKGPALGTTSLGMAAKTMTGMSMPTLAKHSPTTPLNTRIQMEMGLIETMSNHPVAMTRMETIPICSPRMAHSARTGTGMVSGTIQVAPMATGFPMTPHNGGTLMAMATVTIPMVL